eukprot:2247848-Amphidinium_carterae.3
MRLKARGCRLLICLVLGKLMCRLTVAANLGTAEHGLVEPAIQWTRWAQIAQDVRLFWVLSKLKECHALCCRSKCVVKHETFAQCLDCDQQVGRVRGEFNFHKKYSNPGNGVG